MVKWIESRCFLLNKKEFNSFIVSPHKFKSSKIISEIDAYIDIKQKQPKKLSNTNNSMFPKITDYLASCKNTDNQSHYQWERRTNDNQARQRDAINSDNLIINEAAIENDDDRDSTLFVENRHLSIVKPLESKDFQAKSQAISNQNVKKTYLCRF